MVSGVEVAIVSGIEYPNLNGRKSCESLLDTIE
jgi:hypothetical protein